MTSITHSDLATMYGISRKTLYNWLKSADLKVRKGRAVCWKEQQIIFEMFGDPEEYKQKQAEKAEKRRLEKVHLEKKEYAAKHKSQY